ncbi:unnamed protein product [Durusdinium trenchii]|uniref:Uncharacterized protein n=1 Tax=Durusdinium trenchii TaxID=1381693 RepID=A0ABP0Q3H3_9DINO
MEFLLADSAGEICRYPWSTDVDERALVLYQAVNARGRSCRLFHGHRELKPYHWLSTLDAKLGSLIQVVWTGNAQSVRHERAFAAVKSDVDNTVVTWGDTEWGGDSSKVQQRLKKGATQVFGTFGAFEVTSEEVQQCKSAFAATKANGSVVTWGGSSIWRGLLIGCLAASQRDHPCVRYIWCFRGSEGGWICGGVGAS